MKISKIIEGRIRGWLPKEPSSIILPNKSKLRNMRKPIKYSKANVALISFITLLLLSVFAQIHYQTQTWSNIQPSYSISADKLTEKPENYFVLSNPDQYVLKVLDGQERHIEVPWDDTQIDELTRQYSTNNIEYDGSYYSIQINFVDAFPPRTVSYILAGFVISILGIVVISLSKGIIHFSAHAMENSGE